MRKLNKNCSMCHGECYIKVEKKNATSYKGISFLPCPTCKEEEYKKCFMTKAQILKATKKPIKYHVIKSTQPKS